MTASFGFNIWTVGILFATLVLLILGLLAVVKDSDR
jgi:hypothetical protein